ncbi:MAG TPA: Rv3654c family TadE-like protein [Actinomycetota bacterium]|nr:Rv3654c family TadE-like protein [Actinomycetota bacterium]
MRGERGAVTIVAVTGALVLCVGALGAGDLGAMLFARARAQSAADAAALAAVTAQAPILHGGTDPEQAAREEAERNGAVLTRCECEVGSSQATVEVSLSPRLSLLSGWFGRAARASARAALDPDVLTYRDGG